MTRKERIIALVAIVLLAVVVSFKVGRKVYDFIKEKQELRERVEQLQYALSHATFELQRDTIRDSIPVVRQEVVTIDKTDYKALEADRQLIDELRLKIGQVESENRTLLAIMGQVVFKTALDSDSVLHYADRWCNFKYQVKPKKLTYSVRDSLSTIVSHTYKHRFLWWRWGTKGYQVHIVNHNPNARVEYNRYIKVK